MVAVHTGAVAGNVGGELRDVGNAFPQCGPRGDQWQLRQPQLREVPQNPAQVSYVLDAGFEVDDRDRRSSIRRVRAAGFPRDKWLGDFDFDANPNINPATTHELAAGGWIRRGEPLCLIVDSGTGKSHLLIAPGAPAAERATGSNTPLPPNWSTNSSRPRTRNTDQTIARYGRVDLLMIDELGYMELDRRGAELLFQVLTERKRKTASRSPPTNRWVNQTFTDPRLCAAIVERLTYHGPIFETGTLLPTRHQDPAHDLTTSSGSRSRSRPNTNTGNNLRHGLRAPNGGRIVATPRQCSPSVLLPITPLCGRPLVSARRRAP